MNKFNINELVLNQKQNRLVKINDFEYIDGKKIYYFENSATEEYSLAEPTLTHLINSDFFWEQVYELRNTSAKRLAQNMLKIQMEEEKKEIQKLIIEKQIKKEKWNKVFNKLKKIFLLK